MNAQRRTGETKNTGFQIGVRRTFDITPERAWRVLTSRRGLALWLGHGSPPRIVKGARYRLHDGSEGEVRVASPGSHLRLTWRPRQWERPSTVQMRTVPNGDRTVVAFHQEHLPGPTEREDRRSFYKAALEALGDLFAEHG